MRSRAQFKAHPIHPALIPFPFALLLSTLVFDAIGLLRGSGAIGAIGGYLTIAGLGAGVLAAVPGLIDFLYTVPPRSSAKSRAARHGIFNALALTFFAIAFATRTPTWEPSLTSLGLEVLGSAALGYAGWLGGVLVTRNLIGVDHRYAAAGKWQEATLTGEPERSLTVAHVDDLKENQMKLLHVNGHRIVLARTSERYCAFEDRCTHRGGSLAGGVLAGGIVQCLWHGSQFEATTGRVTCGPAAAPIRTFAVSETADGRIVLASAPGAPRAG
jgi:nitrite reductase/ring-hydroxylating ferredoxin subunit/uncharacterized membrane protein